MVDPIVLVEKKRVTLELVKLFLEKTSNEERKRYLTKADGIIELYNKIYNQTK